jgi:membrane-associated phospholipid phosphatase
LRCSHFINWLVAKDKQVFLFINKTLSNPFCDWVLPVWRNANTWLPLYLFILYIAIKKNKKQVWLWLLFAIITVALTDQISSHLIKPFVARLRPCADPTFSSQINLLLHHCSGGYSFTSSHACNHFGIAIYFIGTLPSLKKYQYLLIFWATIICIAQIYVGVHYPLDVVCGAIVGVLIAKCTSNIYIAKSRFI